MTTRYEHNLDQNTTQKGSNSRDLRGRVIVIDHASLASRIFDVTHRPMTSVDSLLDAIGELATTDLSAAPDAIITSVHSIIGNPAEFVSAIRRLDPAVTLMVITDHPGHEDQFADQAVTDGFDVVLHEPLTRIDLERAMTESNRIARHTFITSSVKAPDNGTPIVPPKLTSSRFGDAITDLPVPPPPEVTVYPENTVNADEIIDLTDDEIDLFEDVGEVPKILSIDDDHRNNMAIISEPIDVQTTPPVLTEDTVISEDETETNDVVADQIKPDDLDDTKIEVDETIIPEIEVCITSCDLTNRDLPIALAVEVADTSDTNKDDEILLNPTLPETKTPESYTNIGTETVDLQTEQIQIQIEDKQIEAETEQLTEPDDSTADTVRYKEDVIKISSPQTLPETYSDLGDINLVRQVTRNTRDADLFSTLAKLLIARTGDPDIILSIDPPKYDQENRTKQDHISVAPICIAENDAKITAYVSSPNINTDRLTRLATWCAAWLQLQKTTADLWRMAYTDQLTKAWNRRYFDLFVTPILENARDKRLWVTIMVFDIDNFKKYNDQYGHAAGDEILRETVRLLESVIRPTDIVCRIGGDEFAVVFHDPSPSGDRDSATRHPSDIEQIATRFQQQVSQLNFPKLRNDAKGSLTISGGLATYPWDGTTPQQLVEVADMRTIASKRAGKNAITFGPDA